MNYSGRVPATLGLLGLLGTAPLRAQVCAGYPSLDDHRFRLAATGVSYTYGTALGLSFTAGKRVFGTIGVARIRDPELDATALDFSLEGGVEIPHRTRQVFLCLLASITATRGPYDFLLSDDHYSGVAGAIGVGIGGLAARSGRIGIVPAADLRVIRLKMWRRFMTPDPTISAASDSYGVLGIGVGVIVRDVGTIRPGITVPFGLVGPENRDNFAVPFAREEGEISLGISIAIHFGRRPALKEGP